MSEEEDKKEKLKKTGAADYSANVFIITDQETIDELTMSTANVTKITVSSHYL